MRAMTPWALKGRKIGLESAALRIGGIALLMLATGLALDASPSVARAAALDWSPSALPKAPNATAPDWEIHVCGKVAKVVEQVFGIPPELLAAVARAESGRWVDSAKASFAWPWTVTAEGEGRYFTTKAQAIDAVRRLKARGTRNIDVGCLQINMQYHPKAFPSLDAAFDPMENAIYAAQFLTGLHAETHSWTRAVQLYHSSNPDLHNHYAVHVGTLWFDEYRRAQAAELAQKKRDALAADGTNRDEATEPAQ
jgi:soluble lytic murein transglycosylase-like protein